MQFDVGYSLLFSVDIPRYNSCFKASCLHCCGLLMMSSGETGDVTCILMML